MKNTSSTLWASLLAAGIVLSGCANSADIGPSTSGNVEEKPASFNQFTDIPVPSNAKVEMDRTLVFGSGDTWTGRLEMTTSHSAFQMVEFFKRELPGFGWQEITSVRAKISVLTYFRQERIATIQIQSATLSGSSITVTVSPRTEQQYLPTTSATQAPVQQTQ